MPRQLLRVQRVYKETDGSVLTGSLTTSWTDGSRLSVEHVTDFNEDGGEFVFEPGTSRAEIALYSGFDEVTDELIGVTRPNNRFTHGAGTFVQAGREPTVEKFIDGYLDDEATVAPGIPVPSHLYPYFAVGVRAEDTAETIWVEQDPDGDLYAASAAVGAVPVFDEDLEVLPEVATEPTPPVDEIPVSGVKPAPPTLSAVLRTLVNVEPTWFIDWTVTHSGLKTDGSPVIGLKFRVEFLEGSGVKYRSGDTSGTFGSQMVEGGKTYTVRAYALDIAGQASTPVTQTVTTTPDSTIPAAPTGLTLTGGANGGGLGIIYGRVNAPTESDFSHFEIHASTVSGFEATDATIVNPVAKDTVFAVTRTNAGPFGYTTTVYVRVKSVDTSGNKSPATNQVGGTAQQIASADVTDLQSDNYNPGVAGWRITKSGNLEANSGTFRGILAAGSLIAFSRSQTPGITIDGSLPRITIGSGLILDGSGLGYIQFGSNCTIYGAGSGAISIGSGITLAGSTSQIQVGSNVVIDGIANGGAGVVNVGSTIQLDGSSGVLRSGSTGGPHLLIGTSSGDRITFKRGATEWGFLESDTSFLRLHSGSGSGLWLKGVTTSIYESVGMIELKSTSGVIHLTPASGQYILANEHLQTFMGKSVRIGNGTSTGNYLQLHNTGGSAPLPDTNECRLFYDASSSPARLRARNPSSTQTLCSF